MKQRANPKVTIFVMILIIVVIIVVKVSGFLSSSSGSKLGFFGSSASHTYSATYTEISGSFSHSLSPSLGSHAVHCEIETRSGSLRVQIKDKETDSVIYDGVVSSDEQFDVPAESKVVIRLITDGHSGKYVFKY